MTKYYLFSVSYMKLYKIKNKRQLINKHNLLHNLYLQ